MIAIGIFKLHIIRVHLRNVQVAVRKIISSRLVKFAIPQPPWSPVVGVPTRLLGHPTIHRVAGAAITTFCRASNVDEEVRFPGIIVEVLAQTVVHGRPVRFALRSPQFPADYTRSRGQSYM